jgi:DNA-binding response OmpR family regulator
VVKPFSPRELSARVRSVLRRSATTTDSPIQIGELVVDSRSRNVEVAGSQRDLTRREFDLLAFLAANPGQVFSRSQLLDRVWDSSAEWQDPATVTVHVRRLRNKLGDEPERWIQTVWGVGYRFTS